MTPASKTGATARTRSSSPLTRLRAICLALPEAHEVEAWGESTFRVRNKLFAMFASRGNHHGSGRPAVWLKTAPGNQPFMISYAPTRFFVPPYVGTSGWVGVWLDEVADWVELPGLVTDSWRLTAPKRVAAQLPEDDEVTTTKAKGATVKSAKAKGATAKGAKAKSAKAKGARAKGAKVKTRRPSR
jgi:hypothetical protein